jgi:hypothetical protein
MSLSLQSSLNHCNKVDVAWANRMESDRFFNPANMVCPVWDGTDSVGREVYPDSARIKTYGCNQAIDIVTVENNVSRPAYFNYIDRLSQPFESNAATESQADVMQALSSKRHDQSYPGYGNYGYQMSNNTIACGGSTVKQLVHNRHDEKRCCDDECASSRLGLPYATLSARQ